MKKTELMLSERRQSFSSAYVSVRQHTSAYCCMEKTRAKAIRTQAEHRNDCVATPALNFSCNTCNSENSAGVAVK
jgi:hypothetical protein